MDKQRMKDSRREKKELVWKYGRKIRWRCQRNLVGIAWIELEERG